MGMSSRTVSEFDPGKSYTDEQIQLLFSMEGFANSAKLFARLDGRGGDPNGQHFNMRAGAESLLREFANADRLIARVHVQMKLTDPGNRSDRIWVDADQFHIDSARISDR